MTRNLSRFIATNLALLLVCPAPGLWAAVQTAPVAIHGTSKGTGMILPILPTNPLSGMTLSGMGTLSAPGLIATGISPLMAAPTLAPAAVLSAGSAVQVLSPIAALAPEAMAPAALTPQAAATVKITQIASAVDGLIEAAEDQNKASAENSSEMGDQVFRALSGSHDDLAPLNTGAAPKAKSMAALTQQKMLQTLYQVAAVFSEQYAPLQWKKDQFKVDLKREYEKAQNAIIANPKITTPQFQDLVYNLTAAMKDYHVSVAFNSTERASLPFSVTQAGGKYFLAYVDREKLPMKIFPFHIGDEVVGFDGQHTEAAVRALAAEKGPNVAETDLRLAEIFLTNRRRARGDQVPQGTVPIIIRTREGKAFKIEMPWDYTPELVAQDVPVRDGGLFGTVTPDLKRGAGSKGAASELNPDEDSLKGMVDRLLDGAKKTAGAAQVGVHGLMKRLGAKLDLAIHPLTDLFAAMREDADVNPFMMGARKSFVPRLGPVLWESDKKNPFHAYIFKTKDGRKAGFIRISSYMGGAKEAKAFGEIMAKFQKETDSLVIDQVNNPGGVVTYLYALASYLTDKPLAVPSHRILIDAGAAQESAEMLLKVLKPQKQAASEEDEDESEKDPTAAGYPIDQKFMMDLFRASQFIVKQFSLGKRFSDPTYVTGIEKIAPAPDAEKRYTKPVLLLTNALDFSGGDFFPAIMQDNKRVTQLGVRTAGAGGMVKGFDIPNQFGIEGLHATWSIAERSNGKPIENLGVTPDVPYDLTEKDMRTGFAEYRYNIIQTLEKMMAEPKP